MALIHRLLPRPQFRLRSLFLLIAMVAAPLSVWTHREREYRRRIAAIGALERAEVYVYPRSTYPSGPAFPHAIRSNELTRDDVVVDVGVVDPMSEEMVSAIAQLPTLTQFSFLNCSTITESRLRTILNRPLVKCLDFRESALNDQCARALAGLRYVRVLDLAHTKISGASLQSLSSMRELEFLCLDGDNISNESLRHLAGLSKLEILSLSETPITDDGLIHLRGLSSLEDLELEHCSISGPGLAYLAGLPKLRRLVLSDTPVDDDGLAHLEGSPALGDIFLEGCAISDVGLMHLAKLKSPIGVDANWTFVTAAGAAEFRRLKPRSGITWHQRPNWSKRGRFRPRPRGAADAE